MDPVNGKGFVVGAVAWVTFVVLYSLHASCAESKSCGAGDLILHSILSMGALFSAWMLASVVSGIFPDKQE